MLETLGFNIVHTTTLSKTVKVKFLGFLPSLKDSRDHITLLVGAIFLRTFLLPLGISTAFSFQNSFPAFFHVVINVVFSFGISPFRTFLDARFTCHYLIFLRWASAYWMLRRNHKINTHNRT